MRLTSNQKIVGATVLIALAVIAVIVLVILPLVGELGGLESDRQAGETSLSTARLRLAQLEQAKERAATTQADLLKLGTEMPDSPQQATLIIELDDISNAAGIDVTNITPALPTFVPEKNLTEISLSVQIQGTWADVLDYVRRVNKGTRLLRVSTVSIVPVAPPSSGTTVTVSEETQQENVTLTIKAYVIGDNGALGSSTPTATATP